jgi:hypothetical protein
MSYIDCTLKISDLDNVSIEYHDEKGSHERSGKLGADPYSMLTVQRMNYWINYGLLVQEKLSLESLTDKRKLGQGNPCKLEDLKLVGLILYKILFFDEQIRKGFHIAYDYFYKMNGEIDQKDQATDTRLRLRLLIEKPADEKLGNLPWEFLFIPGENDDMDAGFFFSGEKTELLLTRYVPKSKLVNELTPKSEGLRILVAVASPAGMPTIDQDELADLLQKIRGVPRATVKVLPNPTYEDLSNEINEDKNPAYHILHFVGHGEAGSLFLIKDKTQDDYDEDKGENQPQAVTSLQFRKLFSNAKRKPSLIFLHACKGAGDVSQEGFKSTARELVYAEIPAVVAMQYSISNLDAGIFARTFYEELGKGGNIDEAVKKGRIALGKKFPMWEHPRFGTPVVYLQSEMANEIVKPFPEDAQITQPETQGTSAPISAGVRTLPLEGRESPTRMDSGAQNKPSGTFQK